MSAETSPMESTVYGDRHRPPCTDSVLNSSNAECTPAAARLAGFFGDLGFSTSTR